MNLKIKGKLILDTEICKVYLSKEGHRLFVLAESKQWIEMKEMPGDLKGLVNSLDLAISIVSGKFWIKGPAKMSKDEVQVLTLNAPEES